MKPAAATGFGDGIKNVLGFGEAREQRCEKQNCCVGAAEASEQLQQAWRQLRRCAQCVDTGAWQCRRRHSKWAVLVDVHVKNMNEKAAVFAEVYVNEEED